MYFTATLASLGTLKYAYESIKGEVKPNRVSWFFWGLLPFIGFVIALQKGSTFTENLPLFVAWFFNFTVFLISIFTLTVKTLSGYNGMINTVIILTIMITIIIIKILSAITMIIMIITKTKKQKKK